MWRHHAKAAGAPAWRHHAKQAGTPPARDVAFTYVLRETGNLLTTQESTRVRLGVRSNLATEQQTCGHPPLGDQPKNWRATGPRNGGHQPKDWTGRYYILTLPATACSSWTLEVKCPRSYVAVERRYGTWYLSTGFRWVYMSHSYRSGRLLAQSGRFIVQLSGFPALLLRRTSTAIDWEGTLPAGPSVGTQARRRQQPSTCQSACSSSAYHRSGLYDPCVQSGPRGLSGVSFHLTGRVSEGEG